MLTLQCIHTYHRIPRSVRLSFRFYRYTFPHRETLPGQREPGLASAESRLGPRGRLATQCDTEFGHGSRRIGEYRLGTAETDKWGWLGDCSLVSVRLGLTGKQWQSTMKLVGNGATESAQSPCTDHVPLCAEARVTTGYRPGQGLNFPVRIQSLSKHFSCFCAVPGAEEFAGSSARPPHAAGLPHRSYFATVFSTA